MKALVQMTVQQRESLTAQHSVERRRVSQAVVRHVRSAVSAKRRVMHHHQHRAMSHAPVTCSPCEQRGTCTMPLRSSVGGAPGPSAVASSIA